MADLNLTATVSNDPDSTRTLYYPERANDGDNATKSYFGIAAGYAHRGWMSDLGSALEVEAMTVHISVTYPHYVDYSSDGSTWSAAAGTWTGTSIMVYTLTSPITARYWRIWYLGSGAGYLSAIYLSTWTIEGAAPTPPPDPEPDIVLDPIGEIDADPVPLDLTDIVSWVIRRGSGAEVTGAAEPGSATVRLRNTADKYNPENSGSALIDYLRDGTAIWLGVNDDGLMTGTEPRGLFGGRITDITVLPMAGPDDAPFVEFQCEDALGWYGRVPVYVEFAAGRSHSALRADILAAIGESRYTLASEIMTMPLSGAEGNALTVLDNINRANGTRHFIKPADDPLDWYSYTTYNRQHGLSGSSSATLAGTDIHAASGVGWRLAVDTVVNAQRAVVTPIRFTPNTFTVWEADTLPVIVTPDRPYTVWVEFDDYVQGATLDVARTGDSPTTETLEEFGTRAKITLAQTGVGDSTTYTGLSIQGSLARRLPDVSWLANDTTSQAPPRGVRQGSDIRGEYVGTLAGARGIAEHVVWRYGNPQTRPTLSVRNWMPEQFEIDLGDVISVTFDEVSVTAQLFEVVGLVHRSVFVKTASAVHDTDLVLQKCRVQSDPGWFILNTSELDSADILAY